ncbi:unannotated protein [freshwater metagenome]|uniref:Unannotated protein n=1 Tax=freshwater metagenome TaxID=449393 RepID=A0A6J6FG49_9ZZZZ|nr:hypothetical protein [Actinomycetota bacterium]
MKLLKPLQALSVFFMVSAILSACGEQTTDQGQNPQSSATGENTDLLIDINRDFTFMNDFLAAMRTNGVNCEGYVKDPDSFGVRESGTCSYRSTELTLYLYPDATAAEVTIQIVKLIGGYWVISNNWMINVNDGDVAKDLQSKLKATIA